MYDTPAYTRSFGPAADTHFKFDVPVTQELVTERCLSYSSILNLPEDRKEGVKKELKKIIEEGEGKVWINQKEGIFEYPYTTEVVIFHRKGTL